MTTTELNFHLLDGDDSHHLISIESNILPQVGSTMYVDTEVDEMWLNAHHGHLNDRFKENYLANNFRGKVKIVGIDSGIKTYDKSVEQKTDKGTYLLPTKKVVYYHDITVEKV